MKVINLFAGPGAGKSVLASDLFSHMKKRGYNVELVSEYAKEMVYERRDNILADQLYLLAKQNRRLARVAESGVEWAITDGPLPLGLVYVDASWIYFSSILTECFDRYDNYNVLLTRSKAVEYQPLGRVQKTLEEAEECDRRVAEVVHKISHHAPILHLVGYDSGETLLWDIKEEAKKRRGPF